LILAASSGKEELNMHDGNTVPAARVDAAELASQLLNEHVADAVEILNGQELGAVSEVLARLPFDRAVEIFDQPGLDHAPELIAALPRDRAVAVLSSMSSDRAADLFRHFEEPARSELLGRLEPARQSLLAQLLSYPEDSAGSIMTVEFVSVPANWTVAKALDHVRRVERTRETIYAVYVLDPATQALVQAVPLHRLISGDPELPVLSVARPRKPITVLALTDREEVARLISKYDLLAVPVIDEARRVIGIVTVDDVLDALVDEATEDVQKFGGMEALDEPYTEIKFGKMIWKRAGWLCALFLSEMLTASAMQYFQSELERAIVLTLFIPLIMSSGCNSGSQATSLLIRALALRELQLRDWWRVALRELPTGVTLGAILGLIGIARIVTWQKLGIYDYGEHWFLIAATVGTALVGIVTFGSLAGSMLPLILLRLGFDPASASAPFVATLVDVTGIIIYFGVAALFLTGTLL
jgi:magnesium transporter